MLLTKPGAILQARGISLRRCAVLYAGAGYRGLSNASFSPVAGAAVQGEAGWPLKYKIAGGLVLGSALPWMASYAIAHDFETRGLVEMVAPGLVQWLRSREGGHFEDEDPKRLEYLAQAPAWMDLPLSIEVRVKSGETLPLHNIDPRTPFSSLKSLLRQKVEENGQNIEETTWLSDFRVLDSDEGTEWNNHGNKGRDSNVFPSDSGQSISSAVLRQAGHLSACGVRSWWDTAQLELERERAPPPAPSNETASQLAKTRAQAYDDEIEAAIRSLNEDMLSGVRSVDDAEADMQDLRRKQKEIRRKIKRRFFGRS